MTDGGPRVRRYILTGTPGAGKTSILRGLAGRGYRVVEEAATQVIADGQARGAPEPWTEPTFIDDIVVAQRDRQLAAAAAPDGVWVFDRSPVCTHALAVYLGLPVTPTLARELDRIVAEHPYQRQVFFVRNLGFVEPTAARRISLADALEFERVHEQSYRAFGFELVDVPADLLDRRVSAVDAAITRMGRTVVLGRTVDDQTRCVHYHGPTDVIAIRFACCVSYYPCFECHRECADHPARVWPADRRDEPAVLCGVCRTELSIRTYQAVSSCPSCGAGFNERCRLHWPLYFEVTPAGDP